MPSGPSHSQILRAANFLLRSKIPFKMIETGYFLYKRDEYDEPIDRGVEENYLARCLFHSFLDILGMPMETESNIRFRDDAIFYFIHPFWEELKRGQNKLYISTCVLDKTGKQNALELAHQVVEKFPNIAWEVESDDWEEKQKEVKRLRSLPYQEYLKSDHWQNLRKQILKLAQYRCQLCNKEAKLNVHHRTYERKGEEPLSDLIALCESCHEKHHDIKKGGVE